MKRHLGLALGMFSVLLPAMANARSAPGRAGQAATAAEASCWSYDRAAARNTCSTRHLIMPLEIDDPGSKSIYVTAQGASSANNVYCQGNAWDETMSSHWSTGSARALPAYGPAQRINVGSLYVPSYGSALVDCTVYNGGQVNAFNWNP